jgi:diacylglycerol kinase
VDAEQVRAEIRQTRASIDRKLDLLSSRTSELTEHAKDMAWTTAAATMMAVGTTIAVSWWKRHA